MSTKPFINCALLPVMDSSESSGFKKDHVIKIGAEAEIWIGYWFGSRAVLKVRGVRRYRHPDLDRRLRKERTRKEAYLLKLCKEAGVRAPYIYDLDPEGSAIVMEYLAGITLKEYLASNPDRTEMEKVCSNVGRNIAVLHNHNIAHGDLTTSNIILTNHTLALIDLSLGQNNVDTTWKAVDLHMFREAFESTHPELPEGWKAVMAGYLNEIKDSTVVTAFARTEERGRYR